MMPTEAVALLVASATEVAVTAKFPVLWPAVYKPADEMVPPLAVQGTKRALNRVSTLRADEVVDLAFELEEATLVSADLLEGIAAFREGRAPVFTGA